MYTIGLIGLFFRLGRQSTAIRAKHGSALLDVLKESKTPSHSLLLLKNSLIKS